MNTDKIYAEHIISEYSAKETSRVVRLKKLDSLAKRPANIFAYIFGIISTLVFGTGMCFAMSVLGDGSMTMLVIGSLIGLIGLLGCSLNYSLYKKILTKSKQNYASEIMRLAKEIIN